MSFTQPGTSLILVSNTSMISSFSKVLKEGKSSRLLLPLKYNCSRFSQKEILEFRSTRLLFLIERTRRFFRVAIQEGRCSILLLSRMRISISSLAGKIGTSFILPKLRSMILFGRNGCLLPWKILTLPSCPLAIKQIITREIAKIVFLFILVWVNFKS